MAGVQIDGVNNKIDFDDDQDTSISANTDDTLVFEIAGATDFTMTANTFTAASGSTIAAQALTATTVTASGIVKTDDATEATSTTDGSLQTDGGLSVVKDAVFGDDIKLLSDAAVIHFGADSEITLTHDHNTGLILNTEGTANSLAIVSGDDATASGPSLNLKRDSASPADNDGLGAVIWTGRNDNSQDFQAAIIKAQASDVSDGTEDSFLYFRTMHAGSETEHMAFLTTETVFNDPSNDLDFRVESNGATHMLFVDGGNNRVGMITTPDLGIGLHIRESDSGGAVDAWADALVLEGSADSGMTILSGTGSDGSINFGDSGDNDAGRVVFNHSANALKLYAGGAERGSLSSSEVVFNDGSTDTDFRVEGNGDTHLIFADAGDDDVYIGYYTGGDNDDAMLYVATDQNKEVAKLTGNNGSYGEDVIHLDCTRAGSTNYNLIRATSNGNNDSELILQGAGALFIDGTLTENGADYAEFFEWSDGNSSDEDRVGLSVKLSGNKIVASSDSDDAADIIGVISGNPAVVGDASWNTWNDKHEKDDYGRYVWEDYTVTEWTELADTLGGGEQTLQTKSYQTDKIPDGVTAPDADVTVDGVLTKTAKVIISKGAGGENLSRKKESSSWDATATYVPRAERKEWDAVGLVGKLRMKKGQKTGTNWIKMRDISDTVEEWLVR